MRTVPYFFQQNTKYGRFGGRSGNEGNITVHLSIMISVLDLEEYGTYENWYGREVVYFLS